MTVKFFFRPLAQGLPVPDQALVGNIQYGIRMKAAAVRIFFGNKRIDKCIIRFPENIQYSAYSFMIIMRLTQNLGNLLQGHAVTHGTALVNFRETGKGCPDDFFGISI